VPIGQEHHRGVTVALAVVLGSFDQPLDLSRRQVFARAHFAVRQPFATVRFSGFGETSLRCVVIEKSPRLDIKCAYIGRNAHSIK
jgi:hypothetical protein